MSLTKQLTAESARQHPPYWFSLIEYIIIASQYSSLGYSLGKKYEEEK